MSNPDSLCVQSQVLSDPGQVQHRLALLQHDHIKPLHRITQRIRRQRGVSQAIPTFDPCDGGTHARILLLLEAPGQKAVKTGFISRDNPDPTAAALRADLEDANIPRDCTIIWNAVPWLPLNAAGTAIRAPTLTEVNEAQPWLQTVLKALPELRVICLFGATASKLHRCVRLVSDLPMVLLHHPSPKVYNTNPERRQENRLLLARARALAMVPA